MDPLGTLTETLTPRTGTVRLRLTPTGRVLLVGPFASLGGARQLARRLRPQAGKTSGKKEKAVDRLILAARHVLALSRLLLLIGCATPSALISVNAEQGAYETPDRWDATQQFYTLSTCRKWAESGPLQFGGRSRIEYTCSPYKQLPRAR